MLPSGTPSHNEHAAAVPEASHPESENPGQPKSAIGAADGAREGAQEAGVATQHAEALQEVSLPPEATAISQGQVAGPGQLSRCPVIPGLPKSIAEVPS